MQNPPIQLPAFPASLKDKFVVISIFLIALSIFGISKYVYSPEVRNIGDTETLTSKLRYCNFNPRTKGVRYDLFIDDYSNTFAIYAGVVDVFNITSFQNEMRSGSTIHILIPKRYHSELNDSKFQIPIVGVSSDDHCYLSAQDGINSLNGNSLGKAVIAGIGGLGLLIGRLLFLKGFKSKESSSS